MSVSSGLEQLKLEPVCVYFFWFRAVKTEKCERDFTGIPYLNAMQQITGFCVYKNLIKVIRN